jgi:hypothetical protein
MKYTHYSRRCLGGIIGTWQMSIKDVKLVFFLIVKKQFLMLAGNWAC